MLVDGYTSFLQAHVLTEKLIEKSRECQNHKLQPTPDSKRTKTNTCKTNNAQEAHRPAPSFPSEVITMLKEMKKHKDKEHGKNLKREVPHSIDYKATQIKNNNGTATLERSVA